MRSVSLCVVVAIHVVTARDAFAIDPTRHVSQYVHRHLGARDGLPHNLANSLVQTADGYLWVGTEQGLGRYDGHGFTTFDRDHGLPTNTVSAVAAAGDVLWIGTRERGLVVRTADGAFSPVTDPGIGLQIRALAIDRNGDLWIGSRDRGVARLHAGKVVATLRAGDALPSDDVRDLVVARDGAVWIGTFKGVVRVSNGNVAPGPAELAGVAVFAIVEDRHADVWFGSQAGLARVHAGTLSTIDMPAGDPSVVRLLSDRDGNLWIGQPRGLLRLGDDGRIESLHPLDARVLALVEDRQGDVWIGTELGLDELSDSDMLPISAAEGLTDEAVYGVFEDSKGARWIGATGGLFRWPDGAAPVNVSTEHKTVYAIHEDAHGDVWAGARDGSIGRWHDDKFTWLTTRPWEQVRVIADAPDGLWIGTDHGLFRSHGDRIDEAEAIVSGPIVTAIVTEPSGALWLGTEGGGL
ncbi:MAG TPA: two-component regulator propeller domain-containing protein, partial [Kofleriaceae bacterium]|nr:two-component regulator propeller domain-containing protein [Kofleriaceae bacterium]